MGIIVNLPWPDSRLSPNARVHWAVLSGLKKKARADAAKAVYDALQRGLRETRLSIAGTGPIHLTVLFYPPDKRRRDADNLIASMKASFDGIADALGVDDHRFRGAYDIVPEPEKPGRVEVEIIHTIDADFKCVGRFLGHRA